jgi:outer membrane protein W
MRIHSHLALVAALLVCASGTAAAQGASQGAGKVGLTMGFPAAIGVQWHLGEKVAVRPEISFSTTSSETSSSSFETEGDSRSIGTNIGALFYLSTDDKLRTYVSPRFSWSRGESTSKLASVLVNPITGVTTSELKNTTDSYGFAGSFGAQYGLGDRFVVFGELGLSYAHGTAKSNTTLTKTTSDGFGTRAAVGVVFYP